MKQPPEQKPQKKAAGPSGSRPTPAAVPLAPVAATGLAKALGLSRSRVYQLVQHGMPPVGMDRHGVQVFDVEKCRAWIAAFNPGGPRGGTRPGAGRKVRKPGKVATPPTVATAGQQAANPGPVAATPETTPLAMPTVEDLLSGKGHYTMAMVRTQREAIGALRELSELRRQIGELVEASKVETTMVRALAEIRRALENLPARAGSTAAAKIGLKPEQVQQLVAAVDDELRQIMASIAAIDVKSISVGGSGTRGDAPAEEKKRVRKR